MEVWNEALTADTLINSLFFLLPLKMGGWGAEVWSKKKIRLAA